VDERNQKIGDTADLVIAQVRRWKHDNRLALNAEIKELVLSESLGELEDDIKGAMKIGSVRIGEAGTPVEGTDIRMDVVR
jgi:hypothetical protein